MSKKTSLPKKNIAVPSRSYTLSPEAFALVEKMAEKNRFGVSAFVSECICTYGPTLFKEHFSHKLDAPSYGERLEYLENAFLEQAYLDLLGRLKKKRAVGAHQAILRECSPRFWHKDLKKLLAAAQETEKTATTQQAEWQILVRNQKEFLAIVVPKK